MAGNQVSELATLKSPQKVQGPESGSYTSWLGESSSELVKPTHDCQCAWPGPIYLPLIPRSVFIKRLMIESQLSPCLMSILVEKWPLDGWGFTRDTDTAGWGETEKTAVHSREHGSMTVLIGERDQPPVTHATLPVNHVSLPSALSIIPKENRI